MVVVRLQLPSTGTFVLWGKVTVTSQATTSEGVTVSMTTLDGATALDTTMFAIGASLGTCVPLQSTLDLSQPTTNQIVDIRCSMSNGTVSDVSLIAIPVDALSQAGAPLPSPTPGQ
jgi:hypothetical protein